MIDLVTMGSCVSVLTVGAMLLVRRPAEPQRVMRLVGLAIVVAISAALAGPTVQDAGSAAIFLLGVPVVAAVLPLLGQRFARAARLADVAAAVIIGAWGLLLALGIGVAYLPPAVLYLATAVTGGAVRPATTN